MKRGQLSAKGRRRGPGERPPLGPSDQRIEDRDSALALLEEAIRDAVRRIGTTEAESVAALSKILREQALAAVCEERVPAGS